MGWLLLFIPLFLVSCASKPRKEPQVHPAALSSQTYFVDWGMPVREIKEQEDFFFKKCNIDNTGTYPTKTTYDCNDL